MQQVESIPPSGISVFLNNRDRISHIESAFDFSMPPLNLSDMNTQSYTLLLKQVLLKNYIHNVIANESDSFSIVVNGLTYTNIFESNSYDANSLMTSIQTFFNTINNNLTISYDITESRYIVTVPVGMTFTIVGFNSISDSNPYQYENSVDRFNEIIGFQKNTNQNFVGPTVIVGDDPVNFYGTSFVDINFLGVSLPTIHTNRYANLRTIARFPITTMFGELEVFEPPLPIVTQIDIDTLDRLRIVLTNEWGKVLQGPATTTFSMHFTLVATP